MVRRLAVEPYCDFRTFYDAAHAAVTGGDIYKVAGQTYVYPPMLAGWMTPLSDLSILDASWIWFGLSLVVTLASLRAWWSAAATGFRLSSGGFIAALGPALLLWIEQVRREFETGQCDWLMLAPIVLGAVIVVRRPILAGLLLGFAIHIKYLPLLVVVWMVVRRRWTAAAASVVGVVLWALLPAFVYGWDLNLDYLGRAAAGLGKLVGIIKEGQPGTVYPLEYDYSVSVPSGFARVAARFGYGHREAFAACGVLAIVVLAAAVWIYRRNGWSIVRGSSLRFRESEADRRGLMILEYSGLLAVMLAFSPQTQNRHLFLFLPVILLGTAFLVDDLQRVRVGIALAAATLGTALLGNAANVAAGNLNWGYVGGGGLAVLVAGLLLLDAGLRRLNAVAAESTPPPAEMPPVAV